MDETTSRHLRSASEVLLWIPIRSGFVACDEVILSYSSRLKALLETLFELRRASTERHVLETYGPIERLEAVLNVQWTALEDEQRLLVAASFDRSWESYFRLLADETGSLLDAIFCHCEGYAGNSCSDGFDRFVAWIRQHQKPCDFYFSAAPDVTSDDIRYWKRLARLKPTEHPSSVRVSQPDGQPQVRDLEQALSCLWSLRDVYPADVVSGPGTSSERDVFDGAVSALFFSARAPVAQLADAIESKKAEGLRDSARFRAWLLELRDRETKRRAARAAAARRTPVQLDDCRLDSIQGGILSEYAGTTHGAVLLVQCDTPQIWRRFLGALADRMTSERDRMLGRRGDSGEAPWVNLGLTYPGLERAGLPESTLRQFPKEFREGMEARAGMLGDVGDPDYPRETWPKRKDGSPLPLSAADAVVLVQGCYPAASSEAAWRELLPPLQAWIAALQNDTGVRVLHVQPLQRQRGRDGGPREHFGFAEGGTRGSQPVPDVQYAGADRADVAQRDRVALGEILLGHPNERGEAPRTVQLGAAELLRDGSFLVMRKLEQKVGAFHDYVRRESARLGCEPTALKASLMGRKVDGTALVQPSSALPNDFHYDGDPLGSACPHFAHIRRANPRTKDRAAPRLLRRGFSYGPSYESGVPAERGMLFMAYNTNVAEQFETIQRWINGGNSTLLSSAHRDLVCGQGKASEAQYWIKGSNGEDLLLESPPEAFVRLHWGAYLFVPSRAALRALASFVPAVQRPTRKIERGQSILERLEALERRDPSAARDGWKRVLEEPSSADDASAVWAAVRHEHGGLKSTAYGVLVAKLEHARTVLRDDGHRFSVCEYARRLGEMIGPHYLGLERHSREYRAQATGPNRALHELLDARTAFAAATRIAQATLDGLAGGERGEVHTRRLAEAVIDGLCQEWLELTSPERLRALVFTSRYAFQVSPGAWLEAQIATERPKVGTRNREPTPSPLAAALAEHPDRELALTGAIVGFAAPAIASVVAILDCWADDGTLWRLAEQLASADGSFETAERVLFGPILAALRERPIPSLLYRTAGPGARFGEGERELAVEAGTPVIVGLGAIYDEATEQGLPAPEQWLFGGSYTAEDIQGAAEGRGEGTSHGCPARNAALGVLAGVFSALLGRSELRNERRCVWSYR